VRQIILNFLSNAHKYTPQGGQIEVRAELKGTNICVSVKDNGIGITAEDQAKLFSRFFRANNRATLENRGTGLGLAITRTLVEMQGGEITVTSAPDEGSTFCFTLPVTQASEPAAFDREVMSELAAGKLVLIVDDEVESANLVRRYLERAGYETAMANSAQEALSLARTLQPNLITLDVFLPETDGFALLEWLKHDPVTQAIPVILLTITDDRGRGLALGAADFLIKPVSEQHLLQAIQRILQAIPA
jgi:CheY-like chemotaxis protein